MCKVYNQVGSLATVKAHLRDHQIHEFKSINEVLGFKKTYPVERQQIISDHKLLIEQERTILSVEVPELDESLKLKRVEVEQQLLAEREQLVQQLEALPSKHPNPFKQFINYIRKSSLKVKIKSSKLAYDSKVTDSLKHIIEIYNAKNSRYQYISSRFDDAVNDSSSLQLHKLDRKKQIIEQINNSLYGALGEQKVVKELEKLSDDYVLINDLSLKFHPALYNKQKNDYIKSVQVDHILIGPSGVFLIETKNWSQQSLKDLNMYSPVEQINRANYALYKILSGEITGTKLSLNKHHWGDRKVPIRNIIVLINHKRSEEFQHVKILTLNNLLSFINYFQPSLSGKDVQSIAEYLQQLNSHYMKI